MRQAPPLTHVDGVPAFRTIANDRNKGATKIKLFLSRPPRRMPDFVLTRREIGDLTAHMLSLRDR